MAKKFDVPLDAAGNPILQTAAALGGRRLTVSEANEVTHPIRAIAIKSLEFAAAFVAFSDEISSIEKSLIRKNDIKAVELFSNMVYRAVEFIDVYAVDLGKAINLQPTKSHKNLIKEYNSIIKTSRRDWGLICNKLKHNQNVIAPVNQKFLRSGKELSGFVLCRPVGTDKLDINKDLHQKSERFKSYNVALPQLVHDVFRCDNAAAELIRTLPDDGLTEISTANLTLGIGSQLTKIASRAEYVNDTESAAFDAFELNPSLIKFHRATGKKLHENVEIEISFISDGITRSYMLP